LAKNSVLELQGPLEFPGLGANQVLLAGQFPGSILHLGLELMLALPGKEQEQEQQHQPAQYVGDQRPHRGPGRRSNRGCQQQGILRPDAIAVGRARPEPIGAGAKPGVANPPLESGLAPGLVQALEPVLVAVPIRVGRMQADEAHFQIVLIMAELHRGRSGKQAVPGPAVDQKLAQAQARRLLEDTDVLRAKGVQAVDAAEVEMTRGPSMRHRVAELEVLHAVRRREVPHIAARRIEAHQAPIAAHPQAAIRLGQDGVDGVVDQTVTAVEPGDPRRRQARIEFDPGQARLTGPHPESATGVTSQAIDFPAAGRQESALSQCQGIATTVEIDDRKAVVTGHDQALIVELEEVVLPELGQVYAVRTVAEDEPVRPEMKLVDRRVTDPESSTIAGKQQGLDVAEVIPPSQGIRAQHLAALRVDDDQGLLLSGPEILTQRVQRQGADRIAGQTLCCGGIGMKDPHQPVLIIALALILAQSGRVECDPDHLRTVRAALDHPSDHVLTRERQGPRSTPIDQMIESAGQGRQAGQPTELAAHPERSVHVDEQGVGRTEQGGRKASIIARIMQEGLQLLLRFGPARHPELAGEPDLVRTGLSHLQAYHRGVVRITRLAFVDHLDLVPVWPITIEVGAGHQPETAVAGRRQRIELLRIQPVIRRAQEPTGTAGARFDQHHTGLGQNRDLPGFGLDQTGPVVARSSRQYALDPLEQGGGCIQLPEAGIVEHPEPVVAVEQAGHAAHAELGQRQFEAHPLQLVRPGLENGNRIAQAKKEASVPGFADDLDDLGRRRLDRLGIAQEKALRTARGGIESIQTVYRPDPQPTIRGEGQIGDRGITQTVDPVCPMLEVLEAVAVVAAQTILGTEPEKALPVLEHAVNGRLGKPVIHRQALEPHRRPSRPGQYQSQQSDDPGKSSSHHPVNAREQPLKVPIRGGLVKWQRPHRLPVQRGLRALSSVG
jgi:hypothetical protein